MHSGRMLTARSLTIIGGGCLPRGGACLWGGGAGAAAYIV